jgi:hypothetical protein
MIAVLPQNGLLRFYQQYWCVHHEVTTPKVRFADICADPRWPYFTNRESRLFAFPRPEC